MLAIASAASSIDFTSTPRPSAQRSMLTSNNCRGNPYTSPMKPHFSNASAYTLYVERWSLPGTTSPVSSRSSRVMRCSDSTLAITATQGSNSSSQCTSSSAQARSTGIASTDLPYVVRRPVSTIPRDSRKASALRYESLSSGTGRSSSSARTPSAAQVSATRSESPASWNSGAVGRSWSNLMSRSERMNTRPPATRPCTRPAICRSSFAPRWSRVSTLRPCSTTFANRVSSITTVSSPRTLSAL